MKGRAQYAVALSVTGAFLSPAAVSTWDPLHDPACPLCGQPCTKEHQLLTCPATVGLRAKHQEVLTWMRSHASHWIHGCFAVEHPAEPFLRLVHSTRRFPEVAPLGQVVQAASLQSLAFFTDGSCFAPTQPAASHTGWAVVLCLNPGEDPASLRAHWRVHGTAPASFMVVAQGLTPGRQTIDRAEVCAARAAVQLASAFPHLPASLAVDSATAKLAVERWRAGDSLHRSPHRDLLPPEVPNAPLLVVHKVAAHCSPLDVASDQVQATMGNHCADGAAKAARLQDLSRVREDAQAVMSWRTEQDAMLKAYFTYLQDLAKFVVPLKRLAQTSGGGADLTVESHQQQLWIAQQPPAPVAPSGHSIPDRVLLELTWPPWFTVPLRSWLEGLTWEAHHDGGAHSGGITFLELLINFIVVARVLPPKKQLVDGSVEYWNPGQGRGRLLPISLKEMLFHFVRAVGAISKFSGTQQLRGVVHRQVQSLFMFKTEAVGRKGILARPFLTEPGDTFCLLKAFVDQKSCEPLRQWCARRAPCPADPDVFARWQSAAGQRAKRAAGR